MVWANNKVISALLLPALQFLQPSNSPAKIIFILFLLLLSLSLSLRVFDANKSAKIRKEEEEEQQQMQKSENGRGNQIEFGLSAVQWGHCK